MGALPFVDALKAEGLVPEIVFVGEPTSMRMIRAHKSINLVEATFHGVPAHSSLTAAGVNAIEYAASLVRYWRDQADAWRADGPFDEAYPLAYTTGSVNLISGGNGVNIVPEVATVTLEFRSIAETDDRAVLDAVVAYCHELEAQMQAEHPQAKVDVTIVAETVGLDTPADAPAVLLGTELGLEVQPDKVTYGTEAGIFAGGGMSAVVCGPGDIAQAHKPDEFIDPDQLAQCEAFVARLVAHARA